MGRTISIGAQDFGAIRKGNIFFVDKTSFIMEWWNNLDIVTLITRPRRFGKTLNMSMLEYFFSMKYAGRGDELFDGLRVWEDPGMRMLQGQYPVIFLSFAGVKETTAKGAIAAICREISRIFTDLNELTEKSGLTEAEIKRFREYEYEIKPTVAADSLRFLSSCMKKTYGRDVILLLDEYDTPMQEAYVNGYWNEMIDFLRPLFNNTFKTNPALGRAVMTGVTRITRESLFSDMNNLEVISTGSNKYETSFGFTEEEVFASMEEMELTNREEVKEWYDGFTFGNTTDIYNPWSITHFLDKKKVGTYWSNTSSNALISSLIRQGRRKLYDGFEALMHEETIEAFIDEQVVFGELSRKPEAVWSLLLASGYLRIVGIYDGIYELALTNLEVKRGFESMVNRWFDPSEGAYGDFQDALTRGDLRRMNDYMKEVTLTTISSFDTGTHPSEALPEKFYHGFVLGLTVDMRREYNVRSNRESGYGRYDVMMIPKMENLPAIIMEYKVFDEAEGEKTLEDTARRAIAQIEEKQYDAELISEGIASENIRKYGFAFKGKEVLIVEG